MNIKQIRKELGLTQKQFAEKLGLEKNGDVYIRKLESGRAQASKQLLKAIEMIQRIRELEENDIATNNQFFQD